MKADLTTTQIWKLKRLRRQGETVMAVNEEHTEEFDLMFHLLGKGSRNQLAYILAGSPSIPPPVRLRLSRDEDRKVRRRIAENDQTPIAMLLELCCDPDSEVRLAVADNPNTPHNILEQIATDEDLDVRYGMAENPNIPTNVLLALTNDSNPYISDRAKRTIAQTIKIPAGLPMILTLITSEGNYNRKQRSF